jgi:ABC-2 type transport system permease protein
MIQPIIWLTFMGNAFNFSNVKLGGISLPPGINFNQLFFGASSYLDYFIPGVIAMTALFGGIFGGVSIVWDRRLGYLNKMLAAPISRTSIGTGKIFSAGIRSGFQAAMIGLIAVALLGVTVATGAVGFVVAILIAMLLCLAFAGISMAIGASVRNMEAMFPVLNLLTLPLLFMSSAMFPTNMMPDWMLSLTRVNPVTYAVDPMRALFINDWAKFFSLAPDLIVVAVFSLSMIALATYFFRRSVA